jgi:glucose-6-phosphate dehydrogenase assembly protein OpcA
MTTAPPSSGCPLGQETDVSCIDSSLRALWAGNEALTKASLINFAVYAESPGSLEVNTSLIQAVTRDHACRAILIAAHPSEDEPQLKAWITAHCQLSGTGGKSVCSEQIAFELSGHLRDALRNVVFAHLESDLPLVFFWQGDFSPRWEPHLYRRIDRLVIDSTTWSDPAVQLERLRTAWRDSGSHFVVLDVAWMRIFPFRQALAGAFDTALARTSLCRLNALRITHGPGHRSTAALFASWIAYKAGWSLQPDERVFVEDGTVPLSRLEVTGPGGCRIEVVREEGAQFLHVHVQVDEEEITQVSPLGTDDLATLVSERLSRGGNTPLYFKLWRQVTGWGE